MKNKYLYIKSSIIIAILFSVIGWTVFYFLPTNKYIYNSNNRIKELKRKIGKYKKEKNIFHKTNVTEKRMIQDLSKKFINKFYIIENKENMMKFFSKIYDHIQYYEKKDEEISELQITNESDKENKKNNLNNDLNNQKRFNNILFQMIPNLEEKTIHISFSGELKGVLNFINHITWSDFYISIRELNIEKKFILTLNTYCINNNRNKSNEQ